MVPVNQIWQYWQDHKEEMKSKLICVADIPTEGVEVYLTNEYGYPSFSVDVDGRTEYDEISVDREDTEDVYCRILSLVLCATPEDSQDGTTSESASTPDGNEHDGDELLSREDQNRIDEIVDATRALLAIFMESTTEDSGFNEEELQLVVEEIEDILAKKFGALTRHPTVMKNEETGVMEVVQYPYG